MNVSIIHVIIVHVAMSAILPMFAKKKTTFCFHTLVSAKTVIYGKDLPDVIKKLEILEIFAQKLRDASIALQK